jgi:Ca-activated chloride channel family protein
VPGGVNRVILCTDGDFNVGLTQRGDLESLIEEKPRAACILTVLGFGMGNYKDSTLELLSNKGNGNYGYVDDFLGGAPSAGGPDAGHPGHGGQGCEDPGGV